MWRLIDLIVFLFYQAFGERRQDTVHRVSASLGNYGERLLNGFLLYLFFPVFIFMGKLAKDNISDDHKEVCFIVLLILLGVFVFGMAHLTEKRYTSKKLIQVEKRFMWIGGWGTAGLLILLFLVVTAWNLVSLTLMDAFAF